uniref:Uncharacterized protein n=1 Tax=Arundo donax TaxID=35708 RepID=A0A0A9C8T9_ARUDO
MFRVALGYKQTRDRYQVNHLHFFLLFTA